MHAPVHAVPFFLVPVDSHAQIHTSYSLYRQYVIKYIQTQTLNTAKYWNHKPFVLLSLPFPIIRYFFLNLTVCQAFFTLSLVS